MSLLLIHAFSWDTAGDAGGRIFNRSIVLFIACYAGLGLGRPEVKPSTPEPLPLRVSRVDELGTSPTVQ